MSIDSVGLLRPTMMMRLLLVALLCSATTRASGQSPGRTIELGEARVVRSNVLQEDRELLITLPETYGRTTVGYPVLYVLDGGSNLLHATATVRSLASARNRIPEMIVVAIPNRNRNRDLTPGPGASTFQRVLAQELIPWVERHYRTVPERVLVGHSLGGSFVVHTLLNRPELFDGYVAVSAPLWRYDSLARDMSAGLARAAQAKAWLYLAVGERENEQLRRGVEEFADTLKAGARRQVPGWLYRVMPDEDHSSTLNRALYDALEMRYAPYRLAFFEELGELEAIGGVRGMERHYRDFSTRFGYTALPPDARILAAGRIYVSAARHDEVLQLAQTYAREYPVVAEQLVNAAGYDQLRRDQIANAVVTFKQNVELFPNSPNVYDSLGDALCRAGDMAAAVAARQQAVRVAESRSHPRLATYQARVAQPCER